MVVYFFYIDKVILLETKTLVVLIHHYIQDSYVVFSRLFHCFTNGF